MLLDEHPTALIHHTIKSFHIHTDKAAIGRIDEALTEIQNERNRRTMEAEAALKRLTRTLNTLASQHDEKLSSHSSASHASHIVELDTEKFRIAKAASELEIEGEKLEAELDRLKNRLQELEVQGVEGDEMERVRRQSDDPTVLKLKVYRSLGIDVEADAAGNYNKAIIRNSKKGDVHVVNIDPKFSRFFYAKYFWQAL